MEAQARPIKLRQQQSIEAFDEVTSGQLGLQDIGQPAMPLNAEMQGPRHKLSSAAASGHDAPSSGVPVSFKQQAAGRVACWTGAALKFLYLDASTCAPLIQRKGVVSLFTSWAQVL